MFKKPAFWIVFTLVSIICGVFVFQFYPVAFPMLKLDLKMDREAALAKAKELNEKNNLSPEGYRDAAIFTGDGMTSVYVQLKAGGTDSLAAMIEGDLYNLYHWNVRHFAPNEIEEVSYHFSPEGEIEGFYKKFPEKAPGAALSSDSARVIAEQACVDWNVNLDEWELVETSQEERPSERIDHYFEYERPDIKVGEAPYRLQLSVSGDQLSEVDYLVKVPEGFRREYREMRSDNETIATVAQVAIIVLYFILGIGVGLFFIIRDKWLIWKTPLYWALFIVLTNTLVGLNSIPLSWSWYDTAMSPTNFIITQIVSAVLGSLTMGVLLWLSFMAAESLSRRAFPEHPQLWKVWSKGAGGSTEVLGRTLGGFWIVPLEIAFVLSFYFASQKFFGWWSPVGAEVDPNILGTLYPWFAPIGMSLQAGFWEECLFRAVPLAGAALVGQKFGKRKTFVLIAFFLQAVIFGAGHANYAQQPSYARVVELILPSLMFAWVYLRFGLLVGIISHYAFDAVLMSLPLFIQSADGIWLDRTLVIILTLVPLLLVFYRRITAGSWAVQISDFYNKSWKPAATEAKEKVEQTVTTIGDLSSRKKTAIYILGVIGIVAYFGFTRWENLAPMNKMTKSEAIELAENYLENQGVVLGEDWKRLGYSSTNSGSGNDYVWQEGGKEAFVSLLERGYFKPPHWYIRFARFSDTIAVEERAEEYRCYIGPDGKILYFYHRLPEAREGSNLTEDEAKPLAIELIKNRFQINPEQMKESKVSEDKKPNRKDWSFNWSDTLNYPLDEGKAIVWASIRGDEQAGFNKYIDTPEEWDREQRDKRRLSRVIANVFDTIGMFILIAGTILAVIAWSKKRLNTGVLWKFFAIFLGGELIFELNNIPVLMTSFSTSEPIMAQLFQGTGMDLIRGLVSVFSYSLIIALTYDWIQNKNEHSGKTRINVWLLGLLTGAMYAGVMKITISFAPRLHPDWNAIGFFMQGYAIPHINGIALLKYFFKQAIWFIFAIAALHKLTNGWTKRQLLFGLLFVLASISQFPPGGAAPIWHMVLKGLVYSCLFLCLYIFVFRYRMALIPGLFAASSLLSPFAGIIRYNHPVAYPNEILHFIAIAAVSIYWMKLLDRGKET